MMALKPFQVWMVTTVLISTTLPGCAKATNPAGQSMPPAGQLVPPVTSSQHEKTPAKTRGKIAPQVKTVKIRFKLEHSTLTATLDDNAASREFAALLPLSLTLTDYAQTEKISEIPKKLSTQGAPSRIMPLRGDITYYAPWGNLALFYKDGHDSPGLVRLGKIESGLEALQRPGPLKVTIERIPAS